MMVGLRQGFEFGQTAWCNIGALRIRRLFFGGFVTVRVVYSYIGTIREYHW